MISPRHLARMQDMLTEARDRQARVVQLEDAGVVDPVTRRMPMSLLIDPPVDTRMMREEIFGPILPVVPYDDIDQAIARINAGERPLGLYMFGSDHAVTDRVLAQTHSGGAAVNTCAVQSALPSMGFGGSGMSGMGRHHGIEGFRKFSNARGVVERGEGDMIDAFYSPYAKAAAIVGAALGANSRRETMSDFFEVKADPVRRLLRTRLLGRWTLGTILQYRDAVAKAAQELYDAGIPRSQINVLLDARGFQPQSQEITAAYQEQFNKPDMAV